MKTWNIIFIHFDTMENHMSEAYRTFNLGCVVREIRPDDLLDNLRAAWADQQYRGWDGETYPKFEAREVPHYDLPDNHEGIVRDITARVWPRLT